MDAQSEVAYSDSFVEWFAEEALRAYGTTVPAPNPAVRNIVIKQPIGVAGLLAPWNFPLAMITRKLAPALAAGCTGVVKAPCEAPLSALALAQLGHHRIPRQGDAQGLGGELEPLRVEQVAGLGRVGQQRHEDLGPPQRLVEAGAHVEGEVPGGGYFGHAGAWSFPDSGP